MNNSPTPKISYIVPCYGSENSIASVVDEIKVSMKSMEDYSYEIILINDASKDGTFSVIKNLCSENDNVIGVDLAKNFGQHSAIMAGLHLMRGEIAVFMDDDGQTPADEAYKLIEKIEEGYDAVYATYSKRQYKAWKNLGSAVNSKMTEVLIGKPKELKISSYFALKRFVVEEITKYENSYPYLAGLVLRTTRNICNVEVTHREREEGESGYTLKKLFGLLMNGFTAFSVTPLRIATVLGGVVAIIGGILAIWTIINKFVNPYEPAGWSSLMTVFLIIGGAILLMLGIIGEYIGRIYISINNSPQYVIREIILPKDQKES